MASLINRLPRRHSDWEQPCANLGECQEPSALLFSTVSVMGRCLALGSPSIILMTTTTLRRQSGVEVGTGMEPREEGKLPSRRKEEANGYRQSLDPGAGGSPRLRAPRKKKQTDDHEPFRVAPGPKDPGSPRLALFPLPLYGSHFLSSSGLETFARLFQNPSLCVVVTGMSPRMAKRRGRAGFSSSARPEIGSCRRFARSFPRFPYYDFSFSGHGGNQRNVFQRRRFVCFLISLASSRSILIREDCNHTGTALSLLLSRCKKKQHTRISACA